MFLEAIENFLKVLGLSSDNQMVQFFSKSFSVSPLTVMIIAQASGIVGLFIVVASFQCKNNRKFFLAQGTGSAFFFLNFILIGAFGGAFFNLANLLRGLLFSKNARKTWKLVVVNAAYVLCFGLSVYLNPNPWQIFVVAVPCASLLAMSVFMWFGNDKKIRIFQISAVSPTWIFHNIINLSVGGIVCECFNMVSSAIYLIRNRNKKDKK